jgi:hypothetical protein
MEGSTRRSGFQRLDEFKLPLTDEQQSIIRERVGESVTELTLSAYEAEKAHSGEEPSLRVLEINNLLFSSVPGSAVVVRN